MSTPIPRESGDEYECEMCGETFITGWSKEEAEKEAVENGFDLEGDNSIVCDDCYKKTIGIILALEKLRGLVIPRQDETKN
jgi:hypothetical protein